MDPAEVRERAARAVAHRVRTPLSLVVGPLHSDVGPVDLVGRARRQLGIALEQVDDVGDGIDELVEIGSWPDGFDLRPGRVGELLAAVAVGRLAGDTWHGLTYTVETNDTAEVDLDCTRIRWALDVLVREAIELAGREGHIAVSSRDGDDRVIASVDVTAGVGKTMQGDASLVEVATMIAELHGGTIWTGETPGWRIELPRRGAEIDAPAHRAEHGEVRTEARQTGDDLVAGPDGAPLVLLVEDDAVLRGFLADALSAECRVVTATTAEEAVTIVGRLRPDLIALDLLLPGIGGEQLLCDLHADPDFAGIPVIVVTGRNDDEQRVRLLRDGVDDYVTKPFSSEELRARIQNVLSKSGGLEDLRARAERAQEVAAQLQRALDSRIVIEQAKAFVAAHRGITVDEAFEVLRRHARSHNEKLRDVAAAVVAGFRP